MRVRAMDASGDMVFGTNAEAYLVDSPEAVGQLVGTRLRLWLSEWFADTDDGTPWATQVLGKGTTDTYDAVIRARILDTPGVQSIDAYLSNVTGRDLKIQARISTIYGSTTVTV